MIEKTLHYCWFGNGDLSELEVGCMETWNKIMPDYKIVRWDESSFPIDSHPYVKEAYEAKKYAFVSDYVRLWVLYNNGGIYLDTDYKILKPLDDFLNCNLFMGNENDDFIGTAIIGAEKGHWLIKQWLEYYDTHLFKITPNTYNMIPNTMIIADIMSNYGYKSGNLFKMQDVDIFERDVFYPEKVNEKETYGIHYFRGSWWSEKELKRANNKVYTKLIRPVLLYIKRILKNLLGKENTYKFETFIKKFLK